MNPRQSRTGKDSCSGRIEDLNLGTQRVYDDNTVTDSNELLHSGSLVKVSIPPTGFL